MGKGLAVRAVLENLGPRKKFGHWCLGCRQSACYLPRVVMQGISIEAGDEQWCEGRTKG